MMEGWKETDIGIVSSEWDVDRIDKFFWIQQGKQVSKKNKIGDNQKPFLRTSNLLWGRIILDKLDYLHFSPEEEDKFKLQYNDLLVCEGGDIGRTAIWKNDMEGIYYQNHLHRLRTKISDIDPEFVLNWMQYAFKYGKVYFGRANITTIPNLSKSRLAELIIPKPTLPEQRKIAYILSTIQKAIEQQEKLIKTTTELKKALMQKLFTEGMHGEKQKQTEIGPVPESWKVVKIGEMYDYTSKPRNLNVTYPVPFIPMEYVSFDIMKIENYELRDKVSSGTYVEKGDLLLAKITPSFENGKQGFLEIDKKYAFATTEVIPIKGKENISDKYYLFYFLLKDDIRGTLTGKMEGSTGRQPLSKTVLSNTLIPKPSIKEQKEIAKILLSFDKKIEHLQKKKQSLQDLFKTMLHELMTGQRRVNEIDFENEKDELQVVNAAKPKRKPNPYFKRTVLAAYIVDNSLNDPLFNRTKFQKLLYLAQFAGELDIVSNYHKDAAGPYDNQMMRSIHSQFMKLKWFGSKKEGYEYKYFALQNSSGYKQHFFKYWGEHQHTIDRLLYLFRPFNYERCEIVTTLFECWKEMIANKHLINNKTLAKAYNEFHSKKKHQPEERIIRALHWMNDNDIIPNGNME